MVKTHVRRNGIDQETFQSQWLDYFSNLVTEQPETARLVKRYAQLHNIRPAEASSPLFHPATSRVDGVTLMAFASVKDVETFLQSESYAEIKKAEQAIADDSASEYWTGITLTVVDQTAPEQATAK